MKKKIKFYITCIKWLWNNRDCTNNRAKWRRMMREVEESNGKDE